MSRRRQAAGPPALGPSDFDVTRPQFNDRVIAALGREFTDAEGAERDRWWAGRRTLPASSVDAFVIWAKGAGVAARLREARRPTSQRAFAHQIGMKPQQLNRYETGTVPGRVVLEKIAAATGVSVDWLLTGRGGPRRYEAVHEASAQEPRSWQAALRPALGGGPLEDKLPWHEISVEDRDAAWRELAEDRKRDIMNVLRGMASVAEIVHRTLPRQHAERVLDCLADEMTAYLDAAF